MTWVPYLALQYSWAAGTAFTSYAFILYAGTVVPLQGVWNCFNYIRTRQLKHAQELFSDLISSYLGFTPSSTHPFRGAETETLTFTSVSQEVTSKYAFDNYDDELLTYFSIASTPDGLEYDPNYWIASNFSLPVPPDHFPILVSSAYIPNGDAFLIAKRIKKVLRDRSIVASYDSREAKADCVTKEHVIFRIRLYRKTDLDGTIIVEIQRRDGFDVAFQADSIAILDAAEGKNTDSAQNDTFVYYQDDAFLNSLNYTQDTLDIANAILFPEDGCVMYDSTDMALSALAAHVNAKRVGKLAILVARDLLYSEKFIRLRDVIFSNACMSVSVNDNISSSTRYNRIQLLSLEILANATASLRIESTSQDLSMGQALVLHMIYLVENAEFDPRAADLACFILKNTTRSADLSTTENERLANALMKASRHGHEVHADLEMHSQQCMELMYGEIA
eukprot:scaffold32705_cov76-Cyclotella_meneghiniana.AAC.6